MAFTVKKALEKGLFNNCRLLTGEAGLTNSITWVNILEILDDLSHVDKGEFLITTAYDFDISSKKKQLEILNFFSERKLAAIAIQTGHYINNIPPSFIKYAKQLKLPLIEIPPEVSFKNLTRALMNELFHYELAETSTNLSESQEHIISRIKDMNFLWNNLADSEHVSRYHDELRYYFINPLQVFQILLIKVIPSHTDQMSNPVEYNINYSTFVTLTNYRLLTQKYIPFLIGPLDQHLPLLVQLRQTEDGEKDAGQPLYEELNQELNLLLPDQTLFIGASNAHHDLKEFKTALNEAKKALQAAQTGLIDNMNLVAYQNLGLYRLLMEIKNLKTLYELYGETIAPLIEYDQRCKGDLLHTMQVFLKHMSIKKAAQTLFIHRHTMRYRLDQVDKLTGYNPLEPTDSLQLNLGLHIYHYLKTHNLLREPL